MKKLSFFLLSTFFLAMFPVITAQTDGWQSGSNNLEFERSWLESEFSFLGAKLQIPLETKDLTEFLPVTLPKSYGNEYLSSAILLHCNHLGVSVGQVKTFIERTADFKDYYKPVISCIQDFSRNPTRFIPGWVGPSSGPLQKIVSDAMKSNPVIAYLVEEDWGGYADYQIFLIDFARSYEKYGKYAEAIDTYARMTNRILHDSPSFRSVVGNYLIHLGSVERQGLQTVYYCASQLANKENPFEFLTKKTNTKSYQSGIACVDSKGSGREKIDAYRRLGLGIRSPTFLSIYKDSNQDTTLTLTTLKHYGELLEEITQLEAAYVYLDAEKFKTNPPLSNLVILDKHMLWIATEKAKYSTITLGEAQQIWAGSKTCGNGLVTGLFTKESVGLIALGATMSVFGGPVGIAATGVIFVGAGAAFTGLSAYDLNQQWDDLDLSGKTTGICNTAAQALMTVTGAKASWTEAAAKGVRLTDFTQKLVIDSVSPKQVAIAQSVLQRVKALKNKNAKETLEIETAVSGSALDQLVSSVPKEKRALVRNAGEQFNYNALTPEERNVFEGLFNAFKGKNGLDDAFKLRQSSLAQLRDSPVASAQYGAWNDFGAELLSKMMPNKPKEISLFGKHKELIRTVMDSEIRSYEKLQSFLDVMEESVNRDPGFIRNSVLLEWLTKLSEKSGGSTDLVKAMNYALKEPGVSGISSVRTIQSDGTVGYYPVVVTYSGGLFKFSPSSEIHWITAGESIKYGDVQNPFVALQRVVKDGFKGDTQAANVVILKDIQNDLGEISFAHGSRVQDFKGDRYAVVLKGKLNLRPKQFANGLQDDWGTVKFAAPEEIESVKIILPKDLPEQSYNLRVNYYKQNLPSNVPVLFKRAS
ncbi:hypothetical protein HY994_05665 [Candidatus Micrarchaeota archaeon]|nr:hypothetical protein [Candidatus Micrarchaeota archaeon]